VVAKATAERRAALSVDDLAERRAWREAVLGRLLAFKRSNGLAV
jgi:hypothetical protein